MEFWWNKNKPHKLFFSSSLHANSKSFQQKTAIRYSQQGLQLWGWPPSKTASTSPTAYHLVRGPEYSEDLRGQPFWPFVCRCYYATSWDGYSIAFVCHIMQSLEMKLSTPSLVFSLSSSKKTFLTKNWKEKKLCVLSQIKWLNRYFHKSMESSGIALLQFVWNRFLFTNLHLLNWTVLAALQVHCRPIQNDKLF